MKNLLRGLFAVGAVLAVAGCGADQVACTEIGAQSGIGVEVAQPRALEATQAAVKVCWDGTCEDQTVELYDATDSVDQGCQGDDPDDTCSAQAEPTGDKYGFMDLANLPESSVVITVSLQDAQGSEVFDGATTLTPARVFPNGPDCPGEAVQATVTVDSAGTVLGR